MNKKLIKLLQEESILKYGTFVLRSGATSHYYCDIKEALGSVKLLKLMTNELVKLIPSNATCIAGSGYGGITLASLVAYKQGLPLVLVRDKIKDHGTKKLIDGYVPNRKDYVCIVDDVFTTGSSITETKQKLVHTKARLTKPVVVLNRSNKKVLCILQDKDLKNKL